MDIEQRKTPNHVAIIPDGNRRWAKEHGLKPWDGHDEGAKNIEKLVRFALKKGVRCMTFWGSSVDNLTKRPLEEKLALLRIYEEYFKRLISSPDILENEVKINVIGRWKEQFPDSLTTIIQDGIEKTKNHKKNILNFMLAYSGVDEMVQAVQNIVAKYENGVEVTKEIIKSNLMTVNIPAVDYIIRTGGEPHNSSGFMMWDSADAQLYFSEKMFPAFTEDAFEEALVEYDKRDRRLGE
jgi:undecaprenyl diphosphate synthase